MQFGYTNPSDTEGIMDLLSTGCHIAIYTTGRGSVTGSAIVPVVKVTGNASTYQQMEGDMDFDASRVLTGSVSMEDAGGELLDLLGRVASGELSKPERSGHRESYVAYKYQDAVDRVAGCR
jgi:altronate hydrolase